MPDLAPGDLDASSVLGRHVAVCLRGVETVSPVVALLVGLVRRERLPVKLADLIRTIRGIDDPARVLAVPIDRQLEDLGALEVPVELALQRPLLQIRGSVERDAAASVRRRPSSSYTAMTQCLPGPYQMIFGSRP